MHEAQAAAPLDHPNVCTIHEIDETADGQVFICMAYLDGESSRARLARGPLAVEEALDVAIQAAEGWRRPTSTASSIATSSRPT